MFYFTKHLCVICTTLRLETFTKASQHNFCVLLINVDDWFTFYLFIIFFFRHRCLFLFVLLAITLPEITPQINRNFHTLLERLKSRLREYFNRFRAGNLWFIIAYEFNTIIRIKLRLPNLQWPTHSYILWSTPPAKSVCF